MHTWYDTSPISRIVERPPAPPVDDLLRVYLGQSCGSRAPETVGCHAVSDTVADLWDYLGDFA
jgi:hypothetical protein